MLYENVLFDLYGTLADIRTDETMPFVWRTTADLYKRYGAEYSVEELKKSFYRSINDMLSQKDETFEVDILKVFEELFVIKGVKASKETLFYTAYEFRKASTLFLSLYDGVKEGLDKLKKDGKRLFLLSNAQASFTAPELKTLGIYEVFDDIFISSDYGVKKPDYKFFEIPFKKHGLKKEKSIMVGNDGTADILGAKNFGIKCLYVKTEISPEEAVPSADYCILKYDFSKILKILSL